MSAAPALVSIFADDLKNLIVHIKAEPGDFIRLTRVVDEQIDIQELVTGSCHDERFYFRDKDGAFELAGLGAARVIKGEASEKVSEQLQRIWRRDAEIRVFGGMSFSPSAIKADEWSGFGVYQFTIPFIEFCRFGKRIEVTLTVPLGKNRAPEFIKNEILQELQKFETCHVSDPSRRLAGLLTEKRIPDYPDWLETVNRALLMIRRKEVDKIVLARKKVIKASAPWSAEWIIRQLAATKEKAFLFLLQPQKGSVFLGRTPERLFQLSDHKLEVDAIAGTEPRGTTPEEDALFTRALTESPKEREEQQIVDRYVNSRLAALCAPSGVERKGSVLKLDKVQHLVTRFSGAPRSGLSSFETLLSLHPTPAVGTHPSDAVGRIDDLEPFDRGWYAGPIGWMNRDTAEFAVAIRSALLHDDDLHIFAGAGIVSQSDPEREWQEIEDKMSNYSFITGALK